MPPTPPSLPPEVFRLWREAQDTRVRTRLGGIYYVLAWLLIWLFSSAPADYALSGLCGTLFFGLLCMLRLYHRLPEENSQPNLQRWLDLHWVLILLTGLGWGLTQLWALGNPDFQPSHAVTILATVAFGTAMAFNFPMRKGRTLAAIALLYLPALLALALAGEAQHASLVTLSVYLTYLLLVLNRGHREYGVALALEQELLQQRAYLERLSHTDRLTQLGNRHALDSLFPVLLAGGQQPSSSLALVLLDIDFFKQVNDRYGHGMGDACLFAFAERMRAVFRRDSDYLLRLGGEEFAVLMPDTPLEQARQRAEAFRDDLTRHAFDIQGQQLQVTVSLGVGCFAPGRDAGADAFFKRVDDALYRAKAEGRNRLVLALE